MRYLLTIEAEIPAEEIIGLKEQIAEQIPSARVTEIKECDNNGKCEENR